MSQGEAVDMSLHMLGMLARACSPRLWQGTYLPRRLQRLFWQQYAL